MTQLLMRRPNLDHLPPLGDAPAGLVLRPHRAGDESSLAALLSAAFGEEWNVARVHRDLFDAADVQTTFVVADGPSIVATASARLLPDAYPGSGYVHWVAADPAQKGMRLGFLVSLAVLHEFVRLGCRDSVLETDDFRLPAIKTYLRLGFEPVLRDASHHDRWTDIRARLAPG